MSVARVMVLAFVLMAMFTAAWCDAPVDQIATAIALPDGAGVVLDAVFVDSVSGQYASARDMWADSQGLLISTDAAIQPGWTVKVTGEMATGDSGRMVIADSVKVYVITNGGPVPPMPPCLLTEGAGISLIDVPEIPPQRGTRLCTNTLEETSESTPVFDGSIGSAKRAGGTLTFTGKVVTAVFYAPNTQTVTSFYIQELGAGCNGIEVVPPAAVPTPVEPGNIVMVTGTVVASSASVAECYLSASSVVCTGSTVLPNAVGTSGRLTAGGAFGYQQALCLQTEDQSADPPRPVIARAGLAPVGARVRLWGKVKWVSTDCTVCYVDDGSNLKANYAGAERDGVRVIFPSEQPTGYRVDDYAAGITGVLSAAMSEDTTPQPVPVLRVARVRAVTSHTWYVRPSPAGNDTTHDGTGWSQAFATVQKAVTTASAGDEVWVADGTYTGSAARVTLKAGVNLYGGFAGTATEVQRCQRDWTGNRTVLDAAGSGQVVYVPASTATLVPRLDGFTIRGGLAYPWRRHAM